VEWKTSSPTNFGLESQGKARWGLRKVMKAQSLKNFDPENGTKDQR